MSSVSSFNDAMAWKWNQIKEQAHDCATAARDLATRGFAETPVRIQAGISSAAAVIPAVATYFGTGATLGEAACVALAAGVFTTLLGAPVVASAIGAKYNIDGQTQVVKE